jgi:hypothetical protein
VCDAFGAAEDLKNGTGSRARRKYGGTEDDTLLAIATQQTVAFSASRNAGSRMFSGETFLYSTFTTGGSNATALEKRSLAVLLSAALILSGIAWVL